MTCNTSAVAVCCSSASRCLGQQPRVLHGDHRLRGEVLQQRYLPSRRTDALPAGRRDDVAEQRIVLAERDSELGARTVRSDTCARRIGRDRTRPRDLCTMRALRAAGHRHSG